MSLHPKKSFLYVSLTCNGAAVESEIRIKDRQGRIGEQESESRGIEPETIGTRDRRPGKQNRRLQNTTKLPPLCRGGPPVKGGGDTTNPKPKSPETDRIGHRGRRHSHAGPIPSGLFRSGRIPPVKPTKGRELSCIPACLVPYRPLGRQVNV